MNYDYDEMMETVKALLASYHAQISIPPRAGINGSHFCNTCRVFIAPEKVR